MTEPINRLVAALEWAARGFKVFPIAEGTKDQPMVAFSTEATTDPAQIRSWWQDPITGIIRNHNIGVHTIGLGLVDIDVKNGRPGLQSFADLGGTWDTLVVRTPSGGFHAYFLTPYEIAIAQWKDENKDILGLDIRGFHGYVLAPGSEVDGGTYDVCVDRPLAPLPPAILARCRQPGEHSQASVPASELDTPGAIEAATAYAQQSPGAPQGDRSGACYRLACQLRERGVSEAVAAELVLAWWVDRCSPAMDRGEAVDVVAHAYRYAQNAEGAKSAEADFASVIGMLPPMPVLAPVNPTLPEPDDAWRRGNLVAYAALLPRPWVVERILLLREMTALIAPGGIGKSQLTLTKAILLALGAPDLWGLRNYFAGKPMHSMIYNAEDSRNEMSARVYATCHQMNVDPARVMPFLTLVSGKEIRLKLVKQGGNGRPELVREMVQRLIDYVATPDTVLLGLDPLIALHDMEEGLATGMRYVLDTLIMIAEQGGVAVELAVHTPKPGNLGASFYVGNAEAGRGSVTIRDTCRVVLTLAPPTNDDVEHNSIQPDERFRLLRLDDAKMNYDLLGYSPVWLRKHTVQLWTGDKTAAFMPYDMVGATASIHLALARKIAEELVNDNTADMGMKEMALRIQGTDPLYAHLNTEQVSQRIDRALGPAYQTENGVVRVVHRGGRKMVAFT